MTWIAGGGWYDARRKKFSVTSTEQFTDWVFARARLEELAKEAELVEGWQEHMIPDAEFVLRHNNRVLFIEEVKHG